MRLAKTEAGRNLLRLFFLKQGAAKAAFTPRRAKPSDVNYAAVIGGGTIGAGIVHALVCAGMSRAARRGRSAGRLCGTERNQGACSMMTSLPAGLIAWRATRTQSRLANHRLDGIRAGRLRC